MVFRRPLIKGVKKLRSGVSSDPYRLPNIDMGSAYGRRFRNLVTEIGAELGGVERLGAIDIVLVRQAAADIIRAEQLQADLARGGAVDHEEVTRVSNSARSALRSLRERPQRRREKGPSLEAYLDANAEAAS